MADTPVADRILEAAWSMVRDQARKIAGDSSPATAEDKIRAWAVLATDEQVKRAVARETVIAELSRSVMYAVESAVLAAEDEAVLDPTEAVHRIATSFIHAQNSLRDLGGLFLWDTSEAHRISDTVGAATRGGGLRSADE